MGKAMPDWYVIHEIIGPGPKAEHTRRTFLPDAEWQWHEIARLYNATQGSTTYIGDWHTHPNSGKALLSDLDISAIVDVLTDPKSQTDAVIVIILCGGRRVWRWAAWTAVLDGSAEGRKRLIVETADLKLID